MRRAGNFGFSADGKTVRIQITDASTCVIPFNPSAQHLARPKDNQRESHDHPRRDANPNTYWRGDFMRMQHQKTPEQIGKKTGGILTLRTEPLQPYVAKKRDFLSLPASCAVHEWTSVANAECIRAPLWRHLMHPCAARLSTLPGGVYLMCSKMPSNSSRLL